MMLILLGSGADCADHRVECDLSQLSFHSNYSTVEHIISVEGKHLQFYVVLPISYLHRFTLQTHEGKPVSEQERSVTTCIYS